MVKEPKPGRVKTRLGRDSGMVEAAWWFRHQCDDLFRRLSDPRWSLVIAVSPDRAGLLSRVWPADLARLPQGRGNLGNRMSGLFRRLPPGPVLIVGADIPGISRAHIARAFRKLGDHDAVLGPAPDGGYWLIGLKRSQTVPAGFLEDVRWSTEHALDDTLRSLRAQRTSFADILADVDTAADLARISGKSRAAGG